MVYEAAKPRLNRLRHSPVPCVKRLNLRSFADCLSVCLEIGFMARTDNAKDFEDRSMLTQNTKHTRTVSRILKPDLERHFPDQDGLLVGTRTIKRPRGGITRENEREDLIRLEEVMLGKSKDLGKSTRAMKWTMSPRSFSKNSEESARVSTDVSSISG